MRFILLVLALVCFVLDAMQSTSRVNLQSAGLAFFTLAALL